MRGFKIVFKVSSAILSTQTILPFLLCLSSYGFFKRQHMFSQHTVLFTYQPGALCRELKNGSWYTSILSYNFRVPSVKENRVAAPDWGRESSPTLPFSSHPLSR